MTKITMQAQNLKNALNVAMKTCHKSKGYALDKIEIRARKGHVYLISTNMYILGVFKIDAEPDKEKDFSHVLSLSNAETLIKWLTRKGKLDVTVSEKQGKVVFKFKETGTGDYCELSDINRDFPDISQFLDYAEGQAMSDSVAPAEVRCFQVSVLKQALSVFSSHGAFLDFVQPESERGIERPIFVRSGGALVVVMPVKLREGR